jgi:hypothetical protein
VSFEDADPDALGLVVLGRLHEVSEMRLVLGPASEVLDLFPFDVEGRHAVQRGNDVTFCAAEDDSHVPDADGTRLLVRFAGQPPDFVDDGDVPVVEDRNLGVGGLAVVLVPEAAAQAHRPFGKLGLGLSRRWF